MRSTQMFPHFSERGLLTTETYANRPVSIHPSDIPINPTVTAPQRRANLTHTTSFRTTVERQSEASVEIRALVYKKT